MDFKNVYIPESKLLLAKGYFKTRIDGLIYCEHSKNIDARGYFSEVGKIPGLNDLIPEPFEIKQISHAQSNKNVARGFHAENWAKYVQVVSGKCFSAIADVRPESNTFLNVEIFILGEGQDALDGSLYIPPRLGNSMCVLEGPVNYIYFFNMLYSDRDISGDVAISLFDRDLNVDWPIPSSDMIISKRDAQALFLRDKFPDSFS